MPIWLINILVGLVLQVAGQLISSIGKQDQQAQKIAGVRGTIQVGGDHSPTFIIGRYGTAGKLKYAGTWGHPGGTPNAYYSKVVEVSFLPIRGFSGFFVNGERVTLDAAPTGILGYAVLEYRVNGVDHLWITPYLGDQVAADPLMLDKFGSDPDRPYTSDMVGYGLGYFVATALVNREIFPNLPEYLAEVDGIELDDPRGDDAHDNPIVGIYTILKGIYYDGEWVYGPQTYSDANFRLSNIESEADKCDVAIPLAGGGTMPRFRMGLEVALDAEPHAVVGELLKACQGRWTDLGGVYKFLVGEPGAAVVSFTDEDIVITEQQTFEPFPGLESLFNGMTATYPEPAEAWESKEAPPRYRSDLELLDDNRRLPFSTDYKAVPYGVQVQALMRAALEEVRRFRRHTQTMPPEWWEYEVLDAAEWTSTRNGYTDKQFLITVMEDLPNANQFVGLQEIDPEDYGWDSGYELPFDVTPLVIARPPPQEIIGWNAAPYIFPDAAANGRRIGIEVFYDEGLSDVRAVRVQVREDFGDGNLVLDAEFPYDPTELTPSRAMTWAGIINAQDYEVRGIYVPFSGRAVEWSGWIGVTTADVKLGSDDIDFIFEEIAGEIVADLKWISTGIRSALDNFERFGSLLAEQDLANFNDRQVLTRELRKKIGDVEASFTEIIEVAIGPDSAIGLAIQSLFAAAGGNTSEVNVKWGVQAGPSGYSARYALIAAVNDVSYRSAAFMLDVPTDTGDPTRIVLDADQVVISSDGGATVAALFQAGTTFLADARIKDASITNAKIVDATITNAKIVDATITGAKIANATIGTAQIGTAAITSAKIGDLEVDTIKLADGAVTVSLSTASADTTFAYGTKRSISITFGSYVAGSIIINGQINIPEYGIPAGALAKLNLYRNGGFVRSVQIPWRWDSVADDYFIGNGYVDITYVDIPPSSGSYTYLLEIELYTSIGVSVPYDNMRLSGAYAKK